MAQPRPGPNVVVSWLSKQMAGEDSCRWKLWFKAHKKFEKVPSDFNLAKWTVEHTEMLSARANELRSQGYNIFIEGQNDFKLNGKNGATLAGKADIVAIREDDACVVDCKTGGDKNSDKIQVLLYMLALPINTAHCRGRTLRGEVQYWNGVVHIPPEAVDSQLKERLRRFMDIAASSETPLKVPSYSECNYCGLTSGDCPERVTEPPEAAPTDLF